MTDIPALFASKADELVAFAHQLAELARAEIRPHFRTGFDVISKADASPVTIADRNAEAAMRKAIEAQYPDHGIFGEEFSKVRDDSPGAGFSTPSTAPRASSPACQSLAR